MIITFGGTPGSGKTTIANMVASELNYSFFDVGKMRRDAAKNKNMTIEEFNIWSDKNPKEGDIYFDEYVKDVVSKEKNAVVSGRMAYFTFPNSLKIYLSVSLDEGAKRIFNELKKNNDRNESMVNSIDDQKKKILERMKIDTKRYLNLYNSDCYSEKNFDIVIDTTNISILKVKEKVFDFLNKKIN